MEGPSKHLNMKDYIIIDHVQGGQPRPYADSVYSAYISKRREGVLTDGGKFYAQLSETDVKEIARLFVRRFEDQPANYWRPILVECRAVDPTPEMIAESAGDSWKPSTGSRWFVKIVEAYTD